MSVRVQVIFHSLYGHVFRLAEAIAEGARSVTGAQVELLQVPECGEGAHDDGRNLRRIAVWLEHHNRR